MIVTGDHANFVDQKKKTVNIPVNDTQWTSVVIEGLVGRPRVEAVPAGHVDLHPTILQLMGDGGPTANLGCDVLRDDVRARPYVLAIRNAGARLDGAEAIMILTGHAASWLIMQTSFPSDFQKEITFDAFSVSPSQVGKALQIWTYLLETNRIWNPDFLKMQGPRFTAKLGGRLKRLHGCGLRSGGRRLGRGYWPGEGMRAQGFRRVAAPVKIYGYGPINIT